MPPDDNLLKQLMPIFRTEASGRLETMNRILLALARDISSDERSSQTEEIHREAHSLKGAARGMGMEDIIELSYKMERIFGAVNRGELELTPEHFELLHSSLNLIETIMQCVIEGSKKPPIEDLLDKLAAVFN